MATAACGATHVLGSVVTTLGRCRSENVCLASFMCRLKSQSLICPSTKHADNEMIDRDHQISALTQDLKRKGEGGREKEGREGERGGEGEEGREGSGGKLGGKLGGREREGREGKGGGKGEGGREEWRQRNEEDVGREGE